MPLLGGHAPARYRFYQAGMRFSFPATILNLFEEYSMSGKTTSRNTEAAVRAFYDEYGWSGGEDELFRQFRPSYWPYHQKVLERTARCFDGLGGNLLIVGCGDLPESHINLTKRFQSSALIDISEAALSIARRKLPASETILGSICKAPVDTASVDAVFAAHVVYHIDASEQEQAVREMIRITKPGGRIVILYANPRSPIRYAAGAAHRLKKLVAPGRAVGQTGDQLYFFAHRLSWWRRFEDSCSVAFRPWDAIGSFAERTLIPSDWLARGFYSFASMLERRAPGVAVRLWQYPIVVLDRW